MAKRKTKTAVAEKPEKICAHVRWMIRRDMPEVLDIENLCFEFPWTEAQFINCLRQCSCIGMVAEHDEKIVGFKIYELHKLRLHLLNFAVLPSMQRRGVGLALMHKLKNKLSETRRNRILLEIRESNLDAQLYFRSQGFLATGVLHDFYEDTDEDAYTFEYRYQPEA